MTIARTRNPGRREMERAYLRADATYDGIFFLGVRTTGVFCRPSCAARKPRPENVEFFFSTEAAQRAGFRPCKRCAPLATRGEPPDWVNTLFERIAADPAARLRDEDLRRIGIEPARARRFFKRTFGMTFQAFHRARRLGAARSELAAGADTLGVGLGHGYESASGFREAYARVFGGPPGRARDADCVLTTLVESPIGPLLLAATRDAICRIEFGDPRSLPATAATLEQTFGVRAIPGLNDVLRRLRDELERYFGGTLRAFSVPLDPRGTPFQQAVWRELARIPYGTTISYEELAGRVGRPRGPRAVGLANGRNLIPIVIPCHRVINKSGQLGGYGGGLWRKQLLLDLERGVLAGGALFDQIKPAVPARSRG